MSIKLPLEILKFDSAVFYYLKDASGRTIAGGLYKEDAEEIVSALNAQQEVDRGALCEECEQWEYNEDGSCRTFMVCGACWNAQVTAQPRKKSKKVQIEEELKRSDITALETGRTDIEYGTHDTIPGGDHVVRLGAARRRG